MDGPILGVSLVLSPPRITDNGTPYTTQDRDTDRKTDRETDRETEYMRIRHMESAGRTVRKAGTVVLHLTQVNQFTSFIIPARCCPIPLIPSVDLIRGNILQIIASGS